eukprot:3684109-Rhodomonas_salina.2
MDLDSLCQVRRSVPKDLRCSKLQLSGETFRIALRGVDTDRGRRLGNSDGLRLGDQAAQNLFKVTRVPNLHKASDRTASETAGLKTHAIRTQTNPEKSRQKKGVSSCRKTNKNFRISADTPALTSKDAGGGRDLGSDGEAGVVERAAHVIELARELCADACCESHASLRRCVGGCCWFACKHRVLRRYFQSAACKTQSRRVQGLGGAKV